MFMSSCIEALTTPDDAMPARASIKNLNYCFLETIISRVKKIRSWRKRMSHEVKLKHLSLQNVPCLGLHQVQGQTK